MFSAGQEVWHLGRGVKLLWRSWDDEVVVYNVTSGQTHLLDAFSAAVLKTIEATPGTLEQLTGHFAKSLETDRDALAPRLVEISSRFSELGLAEPSQK